MKRYLFVLILFQFAVQSFGQSNRYLQLLEIAKGQAGLVLWSKPARVSLDSGIIKQYFRRVFKVEINDSLLSDLIHSTRMMDTTKWKAEEFSRTVLIEDRSITINTKRILDSWKISDKIERKKYRQFLNNWINTNEQERPVNRLSKPVLTKNEEYGVIKKDLTEGGLCCGGQVNLYKYESGGWKDVGVIYSWKY